MPLKNFKPTSAGLRFRQSPDFAGLTKKRPERALIESKQRRAGRNAQGKITTRHRGGGEKRYYRVIDFKRDKDGVPARVVAIEYDPNRSARIALVQYQDGEKRYILAPNGLRVGATVSSGPSAEIAVGSALALSDIPLGTQIHNIELHPGRGGQLVRGAGTAAQLMAREGSWATVRLPSGEMRLVHVTCKATIGSVGNAEHATIKLGKAGRSRWLGRRPTVRGSAMTPRDHPHGGGEGKAPIGGQPQTPWGKPAMGKKTRRRSYTDKFILRKRK